MQARHWPILVRVWSARCSDVIFLSVWTNASAIPQSSLTCQACSGGIGRNVLNLLSIYFTFFGKDKNLPLSQGSCRVGLAPRYRPPDLQPLRWPPKRRSWRISSPWVQPPTREFRALFETEKKRHLLEKTQIATWGTVTGQPVPSQAMHTVLGPVTQAWMAWERRSKVSHNSHRTHTSVRWKMMH